MFKKAFNEAQATNKSLLSGSTSEAPAAPPAESESTISSTKPAEDEKPKEEEAQKPTQDTEEPPVYKGENVAPKPEKTTVVEGEEVKQPTDEVRIPFASFVERVLTA